MVEGVSQGGAVREGGVIRRVPLAWKTSEIAFHDRPRLCMTIPWGDVSTAYYSTGIPNIMVYAATSEGMDWAFSFVPIRLRMESRGLAAAFCEGCEGCSG
jgi:short subunit dehydrogenase-like uncharacterized protein